MRPGPWPGPWPGARPGLLPRGAVLLLPLALAAAACGGGTDPPRRASPPAAPPAPAPTPAADRPAGPRVLGGPLCAALGRIVDAEPEGFVTLRVPPADDRRWHGRLVPAGFGDCWIEDDGLTAGARYVCSGAAVGDAGPDPVASSYLGLAAVIDACLALPTWYPMAWRRAAAAPVEPGLPRAVWRVASGGPAIGLAVARHPERELWFVRLTVGPADPGVPQG